MAKEVGVEWVNAYDCAGEFSGRPDLLAPAYR
jgi:hypothetical protein